MAYVETNADPDESPLAHVVALVRATLEACQEATGATANLTADWDKGAASAMFRLPRLQSTFPQIDPFLADMRRIQRLLVAGPVSGAVICVDDGQNLSPRALSALKNTFLHLDRFLLVVALRISEANRDPIDAGREWLDAQAVSAGGDHGASRMFQHGIAMGPFKTEAEGIDAIQKRLEDNAITFADSVAAAITHVGAGVPHHMMDLAYEVYDTATNADETVATDEMFAAAFRGHYRLAFAEVAGVLDTSSATGRRALTALAKSPYPATALDLVRRLWPDVSGDVEKSLEETIESELHRICADWAHCQVNDETFAIPDPKYSFAIQSLESDE